MGSRIRNLAWQGICRLVAWTQKQQRRTIQCRECDAEVTLSEKTCWQCGASDPARVPLSAVTAIVAVGSAVILAVLMFGK